MLETYSNITTNMCESQQHVWTPPPPYVNINSQKLTGPIFQNKLLVLLCLHDHELQEPKKYLKHAEQQSSLCNSSLAFLGWFQKTLLYISLWKGKEYSTVTGVHRSAPPPVFTTDVCAGMLFVFHRFYESMGLIQEKKKGLHCDICSTEKQISKFSYSSKGKTQSCSSWD